LLKGFVASIAANVLTNELSSAWGTTLGKTAISEEYDSFDKIYQGCTEKSSSVKKCPSGQGFYGFHAWWTRKGIRDPKLDARINLNWRIERLSIYNLRASDGGSTNQYYGGTDDTTMHNYAIKTEQREDKTVRCDCCKNTPVIGVEVGTIFLVDTFGQNYGAVCHDNIEIRGDSKYAISLPPGHPTCKNWTF